MPLNLRSKKWNKDASMACFKTLGGGFSCRPRNQDPAGFHRVVHRYGATHLIYLALLKTRVNWVAVKEFKPSFYNKETLLWARNPYYGNPTP